ncbi:hypothetical protein HLB44_01825 [Aquincola sp. S2]|uniref:DUF7379 domain-containing protein n=1 Tax=Pseudaquabacterium terrae TaxID=2732868 RepID=A0ABX2EA60_9BURK|nr:hypothetical protein [Aquabacterium terrae]NRF65715.1 hypothetical protein [Aquabacterium terrae]
MLTREPWLGDALRALAAVQPADDATTAAVLELLSLPQARRVVAEPVLQPDGPVAPTDQPHRADEDGVRDEAPPPPSPEPPDDAGSHRLPSALQSTEPAPTVSPPPWLGSVAALQIDPALAPQPVPPLLPRQRRRAILAAALSTQVAEGAPDLRRVLRELGHGRPLKRVPRLPRRTLRHGAELRIDRAPWLRPFHEDQLQLRDALIALLGAERLHTVVLEGGPQPLAPRPRRRRERAAEPVPLPERPPGAPTPVLVLSDLGSGWRGDGEPPAPWSSWRDAFAALRRQGRHAVVFTPLPDAALPPLPGLALVAWSERTSLGDTLRARGGQGLAPVRAVTAADLLALARELSPAVVVEPALLRRARRELALPPRAEAELAASDLVHSHGGGGLVFDAEVLRRLRAELAESPQRERALRRIEELRGARRDGTAIEEALIALALRGRLDGEAVDEVLRPALKALAAGGDGAAEVASWAAHAWTRMSPEVRETEAARALAFAASRHTAQPGWLHGGDGDGPALPSARWLFGAGVARRVFSVELRRYGDGSTNLVFGPEQPATCALHRVELPAGAAAWLQVEHAGRRQVLALPAEGSVQVDLAPFEIDQAIVLRTLAGEQVEMMPLGSVREGLQASVLRWGLMGDRALLVAPDLALAVVENDNPSRWPQPGERLEMRFGEMPEDMLTCVGRVVSEKDRLPVVITLVEPPLPITPLDGALGIAGPGDDVLEIESEGALVEKRYQHHTPAPFMHRGELKLMVALLRSDAVAKTADAFARHGFRPPLPINWWVDVAERTARRQWRCLIVPTVNGRRAADELSYQLSKDGMPNWRVAYVPDGRSPDLSEAMAEFAGRFAVLLLVGVGPLHEAWLDVAQHAAAAGRTIGWAPDADATNEELERSLAAWPPEVADAVRRRQWFRLMPPDMLARAVASWSPFADPSAVVEQQTTPPPATSEAPAAPPPRPPGPLSSLRARLIALLETREESALGLFTIDLARRGFELKRTEPQPAISPEQPMLLFLHGTSGDVEMNFGALLKDDRVQRQRLHERYADACFAWQYRSLTVGPLANAVALMRALPAFARLHLVTYSGGGIVAELLCRGMRPSRPPAFDEDDFALLDAQASIEPDHRRLLAELNELLQAKAPTIERFVRISAPIEGSSIYRGGGRTSVRLARAMPWVGGVLSVLPGIDALLTDASVVPGPAALVPGAGVQPLLTRRVEVEAPLTVITGISEPGGLVTRMNDWIARTLGSPDDDSEGDHWVSVASAFGGMERTRGVDYLIERGEQVEHAAYLGIERLRRAVVDALLNESTPPGFGHSRTLGELQQRFAAHKAP